MLIISVSYTYESKSTILMFDLLDADQVDHLHRTLTWAANKDVEVTIRRVKETRIASKSRNHVTA